MESSHSCQIRELGDTRSNSERPWFFLSSRRRDVVPGKSRWATALHEPCSAETFVAQSDRSMPDVLET